MSNYNPTYLGEIELNEDTLSHFGVKGMKWGRRIRSAIRNNPISKRRRKNKYVASHLADDVASGRRELRTSTYSSKEAKNYWPDELWQKRRGGAMGVGVFKDGKVGTMTFKGVGSGRRETTTLKEFQKAQDAEYRKRKASKKK